MILNDRQIADLKQQLRDYLGPAFCAALIDPTVMDIKVAEDGIVWLEKHVVGWVTDGAYIPEERRRLALNITATLLGKYVNVQHSRLSGDFPLDGNRFQGFVPPSGKWSLHIRRHAPKVFTWDDYLAAGIMSPWDITVIREHIHKRSNIVWCGATGSGKTTALNTAIAELTTSNEHGVILEDTREIQCDVPNFTRLFTSHDVSMSDLIKDSLRIKPSWLIIGETRDEEWLAVLEAWLAGHGGGMTTLHTNSADGIFTRGAILGRRAGIPPEETWANMRQAIGLIIYMEKIGSQRRVTEIKEMRKEGGLAEHSHWLTTLGPNGIRNATSGHRPGTTLNLNGEVT